MWNNSQGVLLKILVMFEIENEFLKHSKINGILAERGLSIK